MQRKTAVALLLIVLIAVGAAGIIWHGKSQLFMDNVREALSVQLEQGLGSSSVDIGTVEVLSLNAIQVDDIIVYDSQARRLAEAEHVEVKFSPWAIVLGKPAVAAISELIVTAPHVYLTQAAGGRWNFEDLLQETGGGQSAFTGQVTIVDGSADIGNTAGRWALTRVNGSFECLHKAVTNIQIAFHHNNAQIKAVGSWSNSRGAITVQAEQLNLADYQAFCPADQPVKLVGGTAAAVEVVVNKENGQLKFAGEARLDGAAADIDGIPVREAQGLVTFTDNKVYLFNTAQVYGQTVRLRGKITTDTIEPVFDLKISSDGFDVRAVNADIPLQGAIAFQANVTGTPSAPQVIGEFTLAQGQFNTYDVTNAAASLKLDGTVLTIDKLTGNILGGAVTAAGTVQLDSERYQLSVKGAGLDSAVLNSLLPGLSGQGDVDIVVAGERSAVQTIYGTAAMGTGQYNGLPFSGLNTSFYQSGSRITLDYLNISTGQGLATASGWIENGLLKLEIRGTDIPLSLAATQQPNLMIDGTVDFSGMITGTTANPEVAANFTAANGQVLQQPFAQAAGSLRITSDAIEFNNVEMIDGITRHSIQGVVGLTGDRQANLRLVSRQARAENLVKLIAPGENLTGNVDNEVVLTGPINQLNAAGNVKLTEGSFRGFLIARGEGGYRRQDGVTTISNFVVNSLNTQVNIAGVIGQGNELNLDIVAKDVDVARLHVSLPYPLSGQANFSGKLRGTPASPLFDGDLTADSLAFNGRQLQQVNGRISIAGSQIDVPHFGFTQGAGKFDFAGGLNMATNEVYGNIQVENGQLAALLAILNAPLSGVDGQLSGRVLLSGSTDKPNIELTGGLSKGNIKKYPLENIDIDVVLADNVVTVNQFVAKQGQGVLAVHGTADLHGPLNLEIGGRDIDAGLITAWFDSDIATTGKLNFAAQVGGTAGNPRAAVSLEIAGGGVANATFDSLYGLLVLDQGCIHVNQVLLTKGKYRASAYGVIPVAALTAKGRQQAGIEDQMNLKVRLDEADLSILPLLNKEVVWAVGPTQGEITVSGTLAQPFLNGSIVVKDGVAKLAFLADPIQKVGLDIRFAGDKIDIKTFEGVMGSGSYHLTGSAKLRGLSIQDYLFKLDLDKIGVDSKYFKGPLNGVLTLADTGGKATLSGRILFENDLIDIPYVPASGSFNLDLGLDLELVTGNKVRFYNPYLYDIMAEGRVKLGGSTVQPEVSGRISAVRGTVNYLRTTFKVTDASAEFTQFGSFEPVIKLNADTRLESTRVFLSADGPLGAMEFRLTAEPAMSQQEILSLLTLRSRYFDKNNGKNLGHDAGLGRDELMTLLDAGVQMRFVSELEGAFRKAFGFDEFRLVRDTLSAGNDNTGSESVRDREVYNLEISKYLTDRFMLSYTMGIGHDDYSVGVRYDLTRRISVTGSIDQLNRQRFGLETRFKF